MALLTRQVKRARTDDDEAAPSTATTGGGLMNMQRWVWLEVAVPQQPRDIYGPPVVPIFNRHYIPEEIIAHIPIYQTQLNEKLALIEGDAEPIIRDGVARDPQLACQTIRFLASGYLTPLKETDKEGYGTSAGLLGLYNFS